MTKKRAQSKTTATRAKNRRASSKQRKLKAQSRSVTSLARSEEESFFNDSLRLKFVAALFLIPLAFITTETFFTSFTTATLDVGLWNSPEFLYFLLGVALWLLSFLVFPKPLSLYVWGHELSHLITACLFGAKVNGFNANKKGGYIYTSKTNFLISLAPYLFPFYTLILVIAGGFLTFFVDFYSYREGLVFGFAGLKWIWVFMGMIGFTWAFHLTFTIWMITKQQPDLEENGNFFSVLFIYLINLLVISILMALFSERLSLGGFFQDWISNTASLFSLIGQGVSTAWRQIFLMLQQALG